MFSVSSHYVIGNTHVEGGRPCQDNALTGLLNAGEAAFAIVADGCSCGGQREPGRTEYGAMFTVLSIARAIYDHWGQKRKPSASGSDREVGERGKMLLGASMMYGIQLKDLLATSLYAYLSPQGGFVHVDGDGVVAWKTRDGHVHMLKYEWADNRPFYHVYSLSEGLRTSWLKAHGDDVNAVKLTVEHWEFVPGGEMVQHEGRSIALGDGMRGDTLFFTQEQLADIEFVAVCSDGVTQVDGVDWKDAVVQLMDFKGKLGPFAFRRMNGFLEKVRETGEGPSDDISYAVIQNVATPQGGAA